MLRAELLKVRSHLLPWIVYVILAVAGLIPAIVIAFVSDTLTDTEYTTISITVQIVLGPLIAVIFGGWMGASEFRWETWRIILGRDSRRALHLANKLLVFVLIAVVASVVCTLISLAATAVSASVFHSGGVDLGEIGGAFAIVVIYALVWGLIAFGLAGVTRSFAISISATLVYFVLVDALLGIVSQLRPYLVSPALQTLSAEIVPGLSNLGGSSVFDAVSTLNAVIVVIVYPAVFLVGAFVTFLRRDITN